MSDPAFRITTDAAGVITYHYSVGGVPFNFHLLDTISLPYRDWFRNMLSRRNWDVAYRVEIFAKTGAAVQPYLVDRRIMAVNRPFTLTWENGTSRPAQGTTYREALVDLQDSCRAINRDGSLLNKDSETFAKFQEDQIFEIYNFKV